MDALFLIIGNALGILIIATLSKVLFADFLPYPHRYIMDEKHWVEILVKFVDKAKSEIIFTTYAFSSVHFHESIEEALMRAIKRRVRIRIVGAKGLMPESRKKNLENLGCEVTLVPQRLLDEKDRFYNHLFVSDGMHWIWLNPHPPEEKHVHFGSFEMYDYEKAIDYRSKIIALLTRHLEPSGPGEGSSEHQGKK